MPAVDDAPLPDVDLRRPAMPYVLDVGIRSRTWPLPTLTLGGLMVEEGSGAVVDASQRPIPGLYAAGRAAIGVCSQQYVSGLSIADCVFSGRRAGAAVAGATQSQV